MSPGDLASKRAVHRLTQNMHPEQEGKGARFQVMEEKITFSRKELCKQDTSTPGPARERSVGNQAHALNSGKGSTNPVC